MSREEKLKFEPEGKKFRSYITESVGNLLA